MCHFGVDLLIWPVTLSRDNVEIILYVQNPVDPLIHAPLVFHFLQNVAIFLNCGHDKLAMLPKFDHGNRATVPNCVLGNRTMFSYCDNL